MRGSTTTPTVARYLTSRTGQTVKAVARDEDDFEDFDELYRENEPPPPPRPFVTPRGKRISSALQHEQFGLGSEEMSIVDGEYLAASLVKYGKKAFNTSRPKSLKTCRFVFP